MQRLKAAILRQYEDETNFKIEVNPDPYCSFSCLKYFLGLQSTKHRVNNALFSRPKNGQSHWTIGSKTTREWKRTKWDPSSTEF